MRSTLPASVSAALGSSLVRVEAAYGGDVCAAYGCDLADGRRVFLKTRADAPAGFFACEAAGLDWLRSANAIRVPEVLAHADTPSEPFLALEWIDARPRASGSKAFAVALGRGLAMLHRSGAPGFGFERDGFIGPLLQRNAPAKSWAELLREQRIAPLVRRARDASLLDPALAQQLERLMARLEALVGPDEPAARLHGDLWTGNVLCDADGQPCLVDPAAYGGHREMDLAMLQLFGGLPRETFESYHEVFPLAPGYRERVALHQIYPLLVHSILFGRAYHERLASAVRGYVS